jgi:hypothetical protein
MMKPFFDRFKSTEPDKDDTHVLKLLEERAVRGNVIIARGGEEACRRKFGNSKVH